MGLQEDFEQYAEKGRPCRRALATRTSLSSMDSTSRPPLEMSILLVLAYSPRGTGRNGMHGKLLKANRRRKQLSDYITKVKQLLEEACCLQLL
uniref:Acyl-CoA-binding protein n=1 Tax=Oryza sativa subsp. japonica TaxID=39947 RepID=Q8L823_ORYSJ|nr:acyl-CoA-binding protein [Oryza sativa Japonica Group]